MKEISGRVQLPALDSTDTVTTSITLYSVALPTTFQRNLYKCHNDTQNRWVKVYDNLSDLERHYAVLTQTGYISGVATEGANLHYQRIPSSAEVLKLYFLKQPTVLTSTSTPNELPDEFSRSLLIDYTLKEIFLVKSMRDPNFLKMFDMFNTMFEGELTKLDRRLGPERRPPVDTTDEMGLDTLY
jgi:hypothetical protein